MYTYYIGIKDIFMNSIDKIKGFEPDFENVGLPTLIILYMCRFQFKIHTRLILNLLTVGVAHSIFIQYSYQIIFIETILLR